MLDRPDERDLDLPLYDLTDPMAIKIHQVNADLASFAKAIGVGIGLATEKLSRDIHGKIVKRTPVDTGRARASWDVAIGEAPTTQIDAGDYKDTPPAFPGHLIDGTEEVFIVSNLVYIEPLENGHSDQAPLGMVRISVAEARAEIDTIMDGLAKEAEAKS
jgi:hypothetical protein